MVWYTWAENESYCWFIKIPLTMKGPTFSSTSSLFIICTLFPMKTIRFEITESVAEIGSLMSSLDDQFLLCGSSANFTVRRIFSWIRSECLRCFQILHRIVWDSWNESDPCVVPGSLCMLFCFCRNFVRDIFCRISGCWWSVLRGTLFSIFLLFLLLWWSW